MAKLYRVFDITERKEENLPLADIIEMAKTRAREVAAPLAAGGSFDWDRPLGEWVRFVHDHDMNVPLKLLEIVRAHFLSTFWYQVAVTTTALAAQGEHAQAIAEPGWVHA